MCGRARKWIDAAPTASSATTSATNRCTPRHTMRRISVVANTAITTPVTSTTPFNPAMRWSHPNNTSRATPRRTRARRVSRTNTDRDAGPRDDPECTSPVRMCQPTSPSTSRPCHPAAPELMNSHTRIARKNRSESEGISRRAQRVDQHRIDAARGSGRRRAFAAESSLTTSSPL